MLGDQDEFGAADEGQRGRCASSPGQMISSEERTRKLSVLIFKYQRRAKLPVII